MSHDIKGPGNPRWSTPPTASPASESRPPGATPSTSEASPAPGVPTEFVATTKTSGEMTLPAPHQAIDGARLAELANELLGAEGGATLATLEERLLQSGLNPQLDKLKQFEHQVLQAHLQGNANVVLGWQPTPPGVVGSQSEGLHGATLLGHALQTLELESALAAVSDGLYGQLVEQGVAPFEAREVSGTMASVIAGTALLSLVVAMSSGLDEAALEATMQETLAATHGGASANGALTGAIDTLIQEITRQFQQLDEQVGQQLANLSPAPGRKMPI